MKFKYRIGTKVFAVMMFTYFLSGIYLFYIGDIKGIMGVIVVLVGLIMAIDNIYTLIVDRPIEITDEGIGYYVGKKLKYFCEWDKIKKVRIPYYDDKNDGIIKVYCPDKTIRIGTDIVTEDGKRGIEIIIRNIKKKVDSYKIEDKKEEWRDRIGERRDREFHSWIKGAK